MEEELNFFTSSTSYIESLCKSRYYLTESKTVHLHLIERLNELIELEIELGKLGAEKAKSEVLKEQSKNNVRPIK